MVNVPVAPGTSGHLLGATLVAMLVGPWRALIIMAVVLAIQAALFQDGGLSSWGANLLDMGVAGAFVGYTVAVLMTRVVRGVRGVVAGAVLGAFAATLAGATLTATWLALSGLYPGAVILRLMLVTHTGIGLLEAAFTGAILATLLRWRPDLVTGSVSAAGPRRHGAMAIGALGLALVVAAFVAPLASRLPDGLERVALDLGFAARSQPRVPAPLDRSAWLIGALGPRAPVVAGLLGTLLAGGIAWVAARGLSKTGDVPHR
jgi:cobalt/nickel transport system permease protein